MKFTAIDFETADYYRDSACSVALVRVEDGDVVDEVHRLIRPPRSGFVFTMIHGIDWPMVRDEPGFSSVWEDVRALTDGVEFLAAHNATFDHGVLRACCEANGMAAPDLPWRCSVEVARTCWGIYPTKLNLVCAQLGIPLQHHDALSDARACARIMVEGGKTGKQSME